MVAPARELRVWALLDGRAGNDSQTLGVAQALGVPFERVSVGYTALAALPNMLRGASLLGVDACSKARLVAPFPDVVIAAGRRLAPVARFIKKHYPSTFLIHLMHPDTSLDAFDVVVMPQHDHPAMRENVMVTIGAPHGITHERDAAAVGQVVAVLVGGDTKHGAFTPQDTAAMVLQLQALVSQGIRLHITTSRRTPTHAVDALVDAFSAATHQVYVYGSAEKNPYPEMLRGAAAIVVTGDSVAMCSEACATGKPVYIYVPEAAVAQKHREMIASLVDGAYARPLSAWDAAWHGGNILHEAQRIAPLIMERISARF